MKLSPILLIVLLCGTSQATDEGVDWRVQFNGKSMPASPWIAVGKPTALIENGTLRLIDDSKDESGVFEAEWHGKTEGQEIIVEARVRLLNMVGHRESPTATWPQRDGAPICIQLSDGEHEEGLLLTPGQEKHPEAAKGYVRTFTDRFAQADTRNTFHTYRLIIRGRNMAVEMDGKQIIEGRDAFWRPATSSRKFIRFGSTSKPFTGDAQWEFVRLGLRQARQSTPDVSNLKITVSKRRERRV